jgi:ribonuclease Z
MRIGRILVRKLAVAAIVLFFSLFGLSPVAHAADSTFRVTLLGSGVPDPQPDRFSASTLIEAGEQKLLIDVGRGATIRLYQLHVPLSKIDVVFFTHYHSDHTVGMPDLLLTGWLPPGFARRTQPMHVIGPAGLASAYVGDIKGREAEQHLPPAGVAAKVDESRRTAWSASTPASRSRRLRSSTASSRRSAIVSTMTAAQSFSPGTRAAARTSSSTAPTRTW